MLDLIKYDCKSTTGRNLRKLLLLTEKAHIEELSLDDLKNMCFYDVAQGENWEVRLAKEIMDVRNKTLEIDNWNPESLDGIMGEILT